MPYTCHKPTPWTTADACVLIQIGELRGVTQAKNAARATFIAGNLEKPIGLQIFLVKAGLTFVIAPVRF